MHRVSVEWDCRINASCLCRVGL